MHVVFGVALMMLKLYSEITRKNNIEKNASTHILYLIQWISVNANPITKNAIAIDVYVPHNG